MGFEIVPDHFDVVEFGRVLGQPFDGEPVGTGREGSGCRTLLTWIGPLSSTMTTGFVGRPGLGPYRPSSVSKSAMKSVLRLVRLVCTMSLRAVCVTRRGVLAPIGTINH